MPIPIVDMGRVPFDSSNHARYRCRGEGRQAREAIDVASIRGPFLVIGRAGMDLTPAPPGTAIEAAETFRADLGGSSANIAVGLVKLGEHADLVTRVSDDAIGRYCVRALEGYGVGTDHVRATAGERDVRNSLAIYESRVEDHQSVIFRNGVADFRMDGSDVEAIDYARYGTLITTGTVFAAEPSRSAAFRAFELARKAGVQLVFDIDYRPYSWTSAQEASAVLTRAAEACSVVVGNDEEFDFMDGWSGRGLERARTLAEGRTVVYKMGERGSVTFHGGDEREDGIFPVTALKPTGAGDSFMAGFVSSLAQGRDLGEAVRRGAAAAAITVSRVGCAPAMPTTRELEGFLKERG